VLAPGGRAVIYEDIPASIWDKCVCWIHHMMWRYRTGPCRFLRPAAWFQLFNSEGFEVVSERALSRWRNLSHPVKRRIFVLQKQIT
jgi:hypothetical protein